MPTEIRARRAAALPPEERRDAIVEAVRPLLLAHGTAVTTRQIAEAAGIAEGTIFRAFPDKDAVIDAVVDAALDPSPLDADLRRVDGGLPLRERLVAVTAVLQQRALSVWELLVAVGPREHRHDGPMAMPPALLDLLEPDADRLRVPVEVAARRLRAIALALTHPHMVPEPADPAEIVETFLHGLEAHPC